MFKCNEHLPLGFAGKAISPAWGTEVSNDILDSLHEDSGERNMNECVTNFEDSSLPVPEIDMVIINPILSSELHTTECHLN